MSSLVNMLLGGGIAVAIVLVFWLLVGFIDDMQHHHARR
jgi:hypothetical protein